MVVHRNSGSTSAMVSCADVSRLVCIDNALLSRRACKHTWGWDVHVFLRLSTGQSSTWRVKTLVA